MQVVLIAFEWEALGVICGTEVQGILSWLHAVCYTHEAHLYTSHVVLPDHLVEERNEKSKLVLKSQTRWLPWKLTQWLPRFMALSCIRGCPQCWTSYTQVCIWWIGNLTHGVIRKTFTLYTTCYMQVGSGLACVQLPSLEASDTQMLHAGLLIHFSFSTRMDMFSATRNSLMLSWTNLCRWEGISLTQLTFMVKESLRKLSAHGWKSKWLL